MERKRGRRLHATCADAPAFRTVGVGLRPPTPGASMGAVPNRLARETSPYLLQHAHNPVDWYPWGDEAFARARAEDRPILLSIGYSSCHWCHVMERESFENAGRPCRSTGGKYVPPWNGLRSGVRNTVSGQPPWPVRS